MKNITLTRRAEDYHACITDHPEYWAAGKSGYAAIGDLISTHAEQFGISKIEYKQTGAQWAEQFGIEIIDRDGWRTENIAFSTPINQETWERLRDASTVFPLKN
jgi:hypothetical protein